MNTAWERGVKQEHGAAEKLDSLPGEEAEVPEVAEGQ